VKRVAFLAAALLVAGASAAGFSVKGKVTEAWDRHSLELITTAETTRLSFVVPRGARLAVTAKPDTGKTINAVLNMNSPFDLYGAGRHAITVTRDTGAGEWTCGSVSEAVTLVKVAGCADTKYFPRFTFNTEQDKETWKFTYPSEATFVVRLVGPGGRSLEEQDLAYGTDFKLDGGGAFTFEIAPAEGGGEYTASTSR
jgi:hypothetical protein